MSMLPPYAKKMCPCRVKTQEREDVDIDKLVKYGAARLTPPVPVYADLTDMPQSRGEAAHRLIETVRGLDPQLVASLLSLKPDQANAFIDLLRPASKRDEKNNANQTDVPVQGVPNSTGGRQQGAGPEAPGAAGGPAK